MTDAWKDAWAEAWQVHDLVAEHDLARARTHRLSGEPILPPRFPALGRSRCYRCGKARGWQKRRCPECGARHVVYVEA